MSSAVVTENLSDTNSAVMETSSSLADTNVSSEFGGSRFASNAGVASSSYNYPSTAASIASSDVDYQHDVTNSTSTLPLSQPLSRTSTTSCMSVTAFKDGIEGKKVHRSGIPSYPYNLITTMIDNRYAKSPMATAQTYPPDVSNDENEEDDDTSSESKSIVYSNSTNNSIDVPSGPPVSLNEKMNLLKTGKVQKKHSVNLNGPSVGPVVFGKGIRDPRDEAAEHGDGEYNSDDASMTDYVRFQKEAAREYNA